MILVLLMRLLVVIDPAFALPPLSSCHKKIRGFWREFWALLILRGAGCRLVSANSSATPGIRSVGRCYEPFWRLNLGWFTGVDLPFSKYCLRWVAQQLGDGGTRTLALSLVALPAVRVVPVQETSLLSAASAGAAQGLKESGEGPLSSYGILRRDMGLIWSEVSCLRLGWWLHVYPVD